MAYLLPSSSDSQAEIPDFTIRLVPPVEDLSDLKIFWGPEICRLEYLLHLLETGRIVDEFSKVPA